MGLTHVTVSKLKVGVEVLFCSDGSGVGLAQGLSDQGPKPHREELMSPSVLRPGQLPGIT